MWTNSKQGKTIQGQAHYLDMTPGAFSCFPAYIHSLRAVSMKSIYARTAPALKARWHSRTQANTRIRVCGIFELKPYLKYGKPYSTRTSSTEKTVLKYGPTRNSNRTQLRTKPYLKPYSNRTQTVHPSTDHPPLLGPKASRAFGSSLSQSFCLCYTDK
jgi:hypothetical protein